MAAKNYTEKRDNFTAKSSTERPIHFTLFLSLDINCLINSTSHQMYHTHTYTAQTFRPCAQLEEGEEQNNNERRIPCNIIMLDVLHFICDGDCDVDWLFPCVDIRTFDVCHSTPATGADGLSTSTQLLLRCRTIPQEWKLCDTSSNAAGQPQLTVRCPFLILRWDEEALQALLFYLPYLLTFAL